MSKARPKRQSRKKEPEPTEDVSGLEMSGLAVEAAPVNEDLEIKEIIVAPSLHGAKPMVRFNGTWHTKEVHMILRAIPRAFRLHQQSMRKSGQHRFTT